MSHSDLRNNILEVKSKYDAEFRRFSIDRRAPCQFRDLYNLLQELHSLNNINFVVQYTDKDDDLLPINNDDNYRRALQVSQGLLRLLVQRKGESYGEHFGYGSGMMGRRFKNAKHLNNGDGIGSENNLLHLAATDSHRRITLLDDFRRVSSIIDVDVVPDMHRRVKLMKSGSKPLGFYIRDGTSIRVTPTGIEKMAGIFISRLLPGGLAESTGLLAVNDEVIEVNGIEVMGRTLDQVTDMMVANCSNLIITVKPVNQSTCLPRRGGSSRLSNISNQSGSNFNHSNRSSSAGSASELGATSATAAAPDSTSGAVRSHLYEKQFQPNRQQQQHHFSKGLDDDMMTL